MKQIIQILAVGMLFFSCSSTPWEQDQFPEKVVLEGVSPQRGEHCESSALFNALNYQGYSFTEAEIVGISGAMGFIYEMGDFPFLGGRSLTMKEDFFSSGGIIWHQGNTSTPDTAWRDVVSVLQDNNPVILHVDMRYLPYLWGGKYGSKYTSFGWHIITLFGINFDKEEAYVSDTDLVGIQTISLKDLNRARSSQTKVFPPEYQWYWAEKAPEDYSPNWPKMTEEALVRLVENLKQKLLKGLNLKSLED